MANTNDKILEKLQTLRAEVAHHNHLYYTDGRPEISDFEFDRLLDELVDLEKKHPEFYDPNSPSVRVGGQVLDAFSTVAHAQPMLSIDKSYSANDIHDWLKRLKKKMPEHEFRFYVDPKVDGVAVSLRYEDGQLVLGATRGDGTQGDDITTNARKIGSVPLKLKKPKGTRIPKVLEVRGEIYMTHDVFAKINKALIAEEQDPYKNPRNLTAGTLKSLDSAVVAKRKLRFCLHGIGEVITEDGPEKPWATHSEFVVDAKKLGFALNPHSQLCESVEAVLQYLEDFEKTRTELNFDTDGVVIRADSFQAQNELGITSKFPRWAIAYKYAAEQATTILKSVNFQLGKTGAITPRATMDPVELAGTTVTHATLHNFQELARKDIRVGDHIIVEKAGEIIPYVVRSLPELRKDKPEGEVVEIKPPENCPVCDAETSFKEGEAVLRCTNPRCPGRLRAALRHFAARKVMDIDGLGDKLVDQLVDADMVQGIEDLFKLEFEKLLKLERMGKKKADKLLAAIESSKARGMARLLNGFCIPLIGERASKLLAKTYGSMDELAKQTVESLSEIDGIGSVMAEEIAGWFNHEENQQLLANLKELGLNTEATAAKKAVLKDSESAPDTQVLAGKAVCVTGKLITRTRDEIHDLIEAAGGKVAKSVSSKTDYLVAGEKAGSKLKKAESLGKTVLTENQFYELVGITGDSASSDQSSDSEVEDASAAATPEQTDSAKPAESEDKQGNLFG